MKSEFKKWIKCAGIRAIKTMAETAVSLIPAGLSIEQVSWTTVLGSSILAGIVSLLINIKGLPEMEKED